MLQQKGQKPNQGRQRSEVKKAPQAMIVDMLPKEQITARREHLGGQLRSGQVGGTQLSLGSLAPCTYKHAFFSFTGNPSRRQQQNIISWITTNFVVLTLSRAAQTACAQAPGACHLNTTVK